MSILPQEVSQPFVRHSLPWVEMSVHNKIMNSSLTRLVQLTRNRHWRYTTYLTYLALILSQNQTYLLLVAQSARLVVCLACPSSWTIHDILVIPLLDFWSVTDSISKPFWFFLKIGSSLFRHVRRQWSAIAGGVLRQLDANPITWLISLVKLERIVIFLLKIVAPRIIRAIPEIITLLLISFLRHIFYKPILIQRLLVLIRLITILFSDWHFIGFSLLLLIVELIRSVVFVSRFFIVTFDLSNLKRIPWAFFFFRHLFSQIVFSSNVLLNVLSLQIS